MEAKKTQIFRRKSDSCVVKGMSANISGRSFLRFEHIYMALIGAKYVLREPGYCDLLTLFS